MTRWQSLRLLAVGLVVVVAAALLIAGAFTLGMLPTRWADANWPDAAPVIAGVSLSVIQVAWFAVVAGAIAVGANAGVLAAEDRDPSVRFRYADARAARSLNHR